MNKSLDEMTAEELYAFKEHLKGKRVTGRGPEAQYARWYKRTMLKRINAVLQKQGLPTTQPGDHQVYGPGQAAFQRAGG